MPRAGIFPETTVSHIVCAAGGGMTGSVRRISKSAKYADQGAKAPGNSMSHTEKCQEQAFFSRIVCAARGGMTGSVKEMKFN